MNKIFVFAGIILILFLVFACTVPSEVEITGSPSLKFSANMNLNDYFSDMINNAMKADGDTETIPCKNSLPYKVFLLRTKITNEDYICEANEFTGNVGTINVKGNVKSVDIPVELKEDSSHKKFVVLENEKVIVESDYTLTFQGLDDYIEGFEFTDIESKIYIYGSQLAQVVEIDIYRKKTEEEAVDTIILEDNKITKGSSGIKDNEEYTQDSIPPKGGNIDLSNTINNGQELPLKYTIKLPKDAEIDYELLNKPQTIIAEIVIWLPLKLKSVRYDAVVKFPGFFDKINNVIKSLAGTGCIKDMKIKMTIDPLNPFSEGMFEIEDENYGRIENPLDDHSFFINLSEDQLEYININPFDPRFFILYHEKNSILEIANGDIMITTVLLDTKLNYNKEF